MTTVGSVLLKIDASMQSKLGNTSNNLDLLPVAIGVDPASVQNYSKNLEANEEFTVELTNSTVTCIVATKECWFTLNDKKFYGKVLVIPHTNEINTLICSNAFDETIQINVLTL